METRAKISFVVSSLRTSSRRSLALQLLVFFHHLLLCFNNSLVAREYHFSQVPPPRITSDDTQICLQTHRVVHDETLWAIIPDGLY